MKVISISAEKSQSEATCHKCRGADGRRVKARKDIIISAGAVGSPQLLQLSGVGPASSLTRHSIPVVLELPAIGQILLEHFAFFQVSKLRNSERRLSLGHLSPSDPAFFKLMSVDWISNEALPTETLKKTLTEDGYLSDVERLDEAGRMHVETIILYNPLAPGVPVDGLAVLVNSARRLLQCFTWTEIQDFVETEVSPAPGLEPLTVESSDKGIEDQIRVVGNPHFHMAGTCAMRKVLDTNLRVKGIRRLRVVDVSIFPAHWGGHPHALLHTIADLTAEFIAEGE
ncbi:hypothetical protein BCON_0041g00620 [Botryotinia convoluta]|uniref:Glucose-methanol-choline oxidoreductase N-terminal domain-containing protein n=1 Tax=Botryotinia convoluta TaxID=54673 RepID=A0A4Z1IEM8_9HELO|nr:hypothetical protein BCON_0041g00620 [Botryotinia convoluta]